MVESGAWRASVRRHRVSAFYLLTFALSWSSWLPLAVGGESIEPGGPFHFPGLLGPLMAALGVAALADGREGVDGLLRRMLRWKVPVRWYLVAASPLVLFAAVAAVMAATGRPWPELAAFGRFGGFPLWGGAAGMWLMLTVINGFGEETGWRGLAVDRLQRSRSALSAALSVAPVWLAWHVPAAFFNPGYRSAFTLVGLAVGIFAGSVFLTSLYNRSGRSVLVVALWHGTYNFVVATDAGQGTPGVVVSMIVTVWGVALAADELRANRRGRPGPVTARRSGLPDALVALRSFFQRREVGWVLERSRPGPSPAATSAADGEGDRQQHHHPRHPG